MVFLGLEKPVEYGAQQIFDPTMANMVLLALQQYNEAARKEYERGLEDFDKFTTKYGDFISPFAKDMARYGEMVGGILNVVDLAYKDGVDLLRSPEGRMLVHRLTNSINPAEFNTMRSNAKMGYAYLDAVQKLRALGKYSEALELFDIMQNGGLGFDKNGNKITDFSLFSTEGNGGFNTFNRSPIEAVTLQDLTKKHYEGREARVLNQLDFNDPRLKGNGYIWDPKYEWSGYLRSDLLKNAPGAILSLAADPRFAFFREQAKQAVIARGEDPTTSAINSQLMEDIADANTWALIDPTRKANEFALDDYRTNNDIRAHSANAATDYYYKHKDDAPGDDQKDKSGWNIPEDVYVTSLAKAAGTEYLPQGGVDPNMLSQMIKTATKNQNSAILKNRDVFSATGMFISPEKVSALIQSDGKNGNGYFLNSSYLKDLHDVQDVRTSYKGWIQTGSTAELSKLIRKEKMQLSKDRISEIRKSIAKDKKDGYRLKVVPVTDENDNNVYAMVGEDGKWHTYARVRVYMSDGKTKTKVAGKLRQAFKFVDGEKKKYYEYDVPQEGRDMMLEIGLHSNEGSGTPDLSVSARENLGFYGYDATTKKVGRELNSGFPYTTNTVKH